MKLTLLEIVQKTLSAMDSDPVNSIGDTEESLQIGEIAEEVYYELINHKSTDWEFLKQLIELEAVSDTTKPNYLKLPVTVSEVHFVRYDVTDTDDNFTKWRDIEYMEPDNFVRHVQNRRDDESNVETVIDYSSVPLLILNDEGPTWWTTFDDEYIVFDSYNSAVDSTLQASKSLAHVVVEPSFSQTDSFTPDMPSKLFPTYLSQVKVRAFWNLKQQENAIEDRAAKRGFNVLNNKEYRLNAKVWKGFGRK